MKQLIPLLCAAACLVAPVFADGGGAPPDGNVSIEIAKEMEISALLDRISEATGRPVLYDPNSPRIRGQTVGAALDLKVPQSRLFDAFRSVLTAFELTLVPVGPSGFEVYLAIDSRSTNNFVKNRAVFLEPADVHANRDRDGLYVAVFFPLANISNMTLVRTALSTLVSPAGIGRVMEIPDSGVVIMDFAPNVYTMQQLLIRLDQPSPHTQTLEAIELTHGNAKEVAHAVQELWIETLATTPQPTRRTVRTPAPAPRIVPYAARNAVVVRGTRGQLAMIRDLVKKLDQPKQKRHEVQVVRLKYLRADRLAHTLTAMLAAPTAVDPTAQVVADAQSNSIVIAGDRASINAIIDIAKALDVPPLQPTFK